MKQFPYEVPNFIGNRLRELRLKFGYTQSSVAEVLGLNRSTYSYYELGVTRPDPIILGKLAAYYGAPIDVFYDESVPLELPVTELTDRWRRTSRTSAIDPEKIGQLLPSERALILLLRSNGIISAKTVLEELRKYIEREKGKASEGSDEKDA